MVPQLRQASTCFAIGSYLTCLKTCYPPLGLGDGVLHLPKMLDSVTGEFLASLAHTNRMAAQEQVAEHSIDDERVRPAVDEFLSAFLHDKKVEALSILLKAHQP